MSELKSRDGLKLQNALKPFVGQELLSFTVGETTHWDGSHYADALTLDFGDGVATVISLDLHGGAGLVLVESDDDGD